MQNGVAFLMETPVWRSAPWRQAIALLALAATACSVGSSPNVASHSPSPAVSPSSQASASPSTSSAPPPQPIVGAFGVLVSRVDGTNPYTISLIGIDGKVAASAQGSSPAIARCGNVAAAVLPLPVSTSNTRVYFMDAQGVVHFLAPNGDTGHATAVPAGTASRRSMFAVSPDDRRIAVVVDEFTSNGASTRLYAEDLNGGGNHLELFSESGPFTLWPIGWHGINNLVLAKVPSCTQGGGPFCCGPLELHVVDPATAIRRFTIGNMTTCRLAGAPSPLGAVCEETPSFTKANVLDWTAATLRSFSIAGPAAAYLSPGGEQMALASNGQTTIQLVESKFSIGLEACVWIDNTHLMSAGTAQQQAAVARVPDGGMVPVQAQGDCGGRLPGGL